MGQSGEDRLEKILRQRGFLISRREPYDKTLHSKIRDPKALEFFETLFSSYSYRIFLRDIISMREKIKPESFGLFIDREKVSEYLSLSENLGLLLPEDDETYTFPHRDITDIGDSFEHHIQKTLTSMGFDAIWGVKFESIECGGDFDIVGLAGDSVFYVEVKTSPPKHIEKGEMVSFIERIRSLMPELAIFLNDTHLRMKDKLVPLLEESFADMGVHDCSMKRVEREIFSLHGRIFIANTKRDPGTNLRICFNEFFSEKWKREMPFLK